MRPVFQHKIGANGSCFTACIASILEMNVKDLPNFVEFGDKWILELWKFLEPLGLSFTNIYIKGPFTAPERIPVGYHTISGYAPRGYRHAVVGFQGKFIHDPFPGGGGLITVDNWGVIHPVDQNTWDQWTIPFEAKT